MAQISDMMGTAPSPSPLQRRDSFMDEAIPMEQVPAKTATPEENHRTSKHQKFRPSRFTEVFDEDCLARCGKHELAVDLHDCLPNPKKVGQEKTVQSEKQQAKHRHPMQWKRLMTRATNACRRPAALLRKMRESDSVKTSHRVPSFEKVASAKVSHNFMWDPDNQNARYSA